MIWDSETLVKKIEGEELCSRLLLNRILNENAEPQLNQKLYDYYSYLLSAWTDEKFKEAPVYWDGDEAEWNLAFEGIN